MLLSAQFDKKRSVSRISTLMLPHTVHAAGILQRPEVLARYIGSINFIVRAPWSVYSCKYIRTHGARDTFDANCSVNIYYSDVAKTFFALISCIYKAFFKVM